MEELEKKLFNVYFPDLDPNTKNQYIQLEKYIESGLIETMGKDENDKLKHMFVILMNVRDFLKKAIQDSNLKSVLLQNTLAAIKDDPKKKAPEGPGLEETEKSQEKELDNDRST